MTNDFIFDLKIITIPDDSSVWEVKEFVKSFGEYHIIKKNPNSITEKSSEILANLINENNFVGKTKFLFVCPEIFMHVAHCKEFLYKLNKIEALTSKKVIIITHNPSIVGSYWDYVWLYEQGTLVSHKEKYNND